MIVLKITNKLFFYLIFIVLIGVGFWVGLNTQSNTNAAILGLDNRIGYFSGGYDSFGESVLPRIFSPGDIIGSCGGNDKAKTENPNLVAMPNCVNTKAELISFLKRSNDDNDADGTSQQRKVGSAFIVCTMLGLKESECRGTSDSDVIKVNSNNGLTVTTAGWKYLEDMLSGASFDSQTFSYNYNSYYQNGGDGETGNHDAGFILEGDSSHSNSVDALVITKNGRNYAIKYECANPVGVVGWKHFSYWELSATTKIAVKDSDGNYNYRSSDVTANVGDTIGWEHTVINNGPSQTDNIVNYGYGNGAGLGGGGGHLGEISSGLNADSNRTKHSFYKVLSSDVGASDLCRNTRANPESSTSGNTYESTPPVCFTVNRNYSLTPSVIVNGSPVNPAGVLESGGQITVIPKVNNSGPSDSKTGTRFQLTQMILDPGVAIPNGGDSGGNMVAADICNVYGQNGSNCGPVNNVKGTAIFKIDGSVVSSGNSFSSQNLSVDDSLVVGTKICFALSVQPHASNDDKWIHSKPVCITVGKKPKVQVWGGDLISKRNVVTSTSTKNINGESRTFGSWIEYGIFAQGSVNGTASGAAFASPGLTGFNSNNSCNYSKLSFTNAGCKSGAVGNYKNSYSIPDIASIFTGVVTYLGYQQDIMSINQFYNPTAPTIISRTGDLSLELGNLSMGETVILKVDGTVTINGNQTYDNGDIVHYTNINQIPQLIIIANNINIADSVSQIDAWLIAKDGYINTCGAIQRTVLAKDINLSSDICGGQLKVNGPVMANQLYLRRTFGSGSGLVASAEPAEIFNLRPDAYLWALAHTTNSGQIKTVYTTELPPRF